MNCSLGRTRWTEAETDILRRLKASGLTNIEISAAMKRTVASVKERWRWINISEDRLEKKRLRTNAARDKVRGGPARRRVVLPEVRASVVEALLRERDARICALRSLTAIFCGDPAPGWSALDRKQQGAGA